MNYSAVTLCITTCAIAYAIFRIILNIRRNQRLKKFAATFPGPPTLPILGNAHIFAGDSNDILDKVCKLSELYPASPFRVWMGHYLLIHVNAPEQLKVVLLSPKTLDKGLFYDFAKPWFGTGLLTATEKMAEEISENLDGPEFEIFKYTSEFALHTICETAMGVSLETQTDADFSYANTLDKVAIGVCKRIVNPFLHSNFIFNRLEIGKNQKKCIEQLHAFTDNVIQTKKKEFLGCSRYSDSQENDSDCFPRKEALLDHLMEVSDDNGGLSDQALREEVDTIVAAGSDTTAVMTSYVMLMLAFYPEIQAKVYQELCEIYQDGDREELHFTTQSLTKLTYLDRVIKETMRLFPITPFLARLVTEDLDMDEHTLPEESIVILSLITLHRNGDYWPDPLRFDPDRFLPEEVEKRHAYAYLPFSGGPRSCIGSKYAMISMKILLATILRKYVLKKDTVVPIKDLRLKWEFVLRPIHPITLRIESTPCFKRTQNASPKI